MSDDDRQCTFDYAGPEHSRAMSQLPAESQVILGFVSVLLIPFFGLVAAKLFATAYVFFYQPVLNFNPVADKLWWTAFWSGCVLAFAVSIGLAISLIWRAYILGMVLAVVFAGCLFTGFLALAFSAPSGFKG